MLRSTAVIPVFFDLFTPSTLKAIQMFLFEECLIKFKKTYNKTPLPGPNQKQQKAPHCVFNVAFTLFHRCLVPLPSARTLDEGGGVDGTVDSGYGTVDSAVDSTQHSRQRNRHDTRHYGTSSMDLLAGCWSREKKNIHFSKTIISIVFTVKKHIFFNFRQSETFKNSRGDSSRTWWSWLELAKNRHFSKNCNFYCVYNEKTYIFQLWTVRNRKKQSGGLLANVGATGSDCFLRFLTVHNDLFDNVLELF